MERVPGDQLEVDPTFVTASNSGDELNGDAQELTLQTLELQMKKIGEIQHNTARTMGQVIVENVSLRDQLIGIREHTQDLGHYLNKKVEALANGLTLTNEGLTLTNEKMDALGNENAKSGKEIQRQIGEILAKMEEAAARSTSNSVGQEPPLNSTLRRNNAQVSNCTGLNDTNISQLGDSRVLKSVTPDIFRGKNQSIQDYLTHFNMYSELSNWDDFHKQRVLLLSAKDEAADYLYGID